MYLAPPTSGAGALTVTTAGGTSAPFAWNAIDPNLGVLSDVASDPATGAVYVAEYNGNQIQRIDPNTGSAIGSAIALPGGNSYRLTGLQASPQSAMSLAGVVGAVGQPAGGRRLRQPRPGGRDQPGPPGRSRVATLILHDNLDANAGVYDPAGGKLYLLRSAPTAGGGGRPQDGADAIAVCHAGERRLLERRAGAGPDDRSNLLAGVGGVERGLRG